MSRYVHCVRMTNEKTKEVKPFVVAYGFDHALGYFLDVFDKSVKEDGKDGEENDEPVISVSSRLSGLANSEMLGYFIAFSVPEEHSNFLVLNLPF